MQLIVITNPTDLSNEHDTIHALFEIGLNCLHLRKPEKDKNELEAFLLKIKPAYYKKIVIHSHYSLIEKYNLKGIHLPEKMMKEEAFLGMVKALRRRGLSASASIHSINTIEECKSFDYVFFSPVFDSISKAGYESKIDLNAFIKMKTEKTFPTKVIGLGGVNSENIKFLAEAGFDGAAMLGSVWNSNDINQRLKEFTSIKSKLNLVRS